MTSEKKDKMTESSKRHIWYIPTEDKLFETHFDIGTVVYETSKGNGMPGVIKIEVTKDLKQGRLFGEDGSICEYIGEL